MKENHYSYVQKKKRRKKNTYMYRNVTAEVFFYIQCNHELLLGTG